MHQIRDSFKSLPIFPAKIEQKHNPGTNIARLEQEQKWEKMSADLLELKVELVNTGSLFVAFQNLIDFLKAVLSEDWQTLHDLGPGSDKSTKKAKY